MIGAIGALERQRVPAAVVAWWGGEGPLGGRAVKVSGALALGLLGGGFLGGFTTFSTWMVEAHRLGERGNRRLAAIYVLGSMAAGLAATGTGWLVGSALR